MNFIIRYFIAILWGVMATPSDAMEFRIISIPDQLIPGSDINAILGEGEIVEGDSTRLRDIIPQADRDLYGNIPLFLNSPGGSVSAAFEIVSVMDEHEFSAIVSSNAICASACATIIYISARFHIVTGSGLLGIHTCYIQGKRLTSPKPSAFCNELIAKNAADHGTSYGVVNMWQSYGPDEMAWIGKDVACKFGLCGPPGFDVTVAKPSFNCKTANNPPEIAICTDRRLARHEAQLSKFYFETYNKMPAAKRKRFRDEQRAWLKYRDACREPDMKSCLINRMELRWNEVIDEWAKYQ